MRRFATAVILSGVFALVFVFSFRVPIAEKFSGVLVKKYYIPAHRAGDDAKAVQASFFVPHNHYYIKKNLEPANIVPRVYWFVIGSTRKAVAVTVSAETFARYRVGDHVTVFK